MMSLLYIFCGAQSRGWIGVRKYLPFSIGVIAGGDGVIT